MDRYIDDCIRIFSPLLATRRCRTDGIWDRPYFIRSDEFHNILNMVCKTTNLYFIFTIITFILSD